MDKQRCHCNGSRGTDCDWCGGSGWRTAPVRLNTQPLLTPLKKEVLRIDKPQLNTEIFKPKKQSFDERIIELNSCVKTMGNDLTDESKHYLHKKILDLNADIARLENRVKKKQREHFDKIKAQSMQLIKEFDERFESAIIEADKPVVKIKVLTQEVKKPNKTSHKTKKINQPTLVNKFKDLFDTLKKKLQH